MKSIRSLSVHLKKPCFQAASPRIGGAIPAPYIALYLPNVTVAAMPFYVMGSMAGEYLLGNRRKKSYYFSFLFLPNFYFPLSYRRPSHPAASRDPWVKVGFSFSRFVRFAIWLKSDLPAFSYLKQASSFRLPETLEDVAKMKANQKSFWKCVNPCQ